jgi:hypothetical protein
MLLIVCESCGGKFRAPDKAAGKRVKCPKCANMIQVPEADPAPSDDPNAAGVTQTPPQNKGKSSSGSKPPPVPKTTGKATWDNDDVGNGEDDDDRDRNRRKRYDDDVDDDDRRHDDLNVRKKKPEESIGLSVTSLVLGIVGIVLFISVGGSATCGGFVLACCCPLGPLAGAFTGVTVSAIPAILATIFGYMGKDKGGRGMAMTGMILGIVTLALAVILVVVLGVMSLLGVAFLGIAGAGAPPNPPPQGF